MVADWLLASDLDYTLLGDDRALERFAAWIRPRRQRLLLVYASGRHYESVVESIRSTALPNPNAVIGGVGTDVRYFPSGLPVPGWNDRLGDGWDARRVVETLSSFSWLQPQPPESQTRFKVSFYATNLSDGSLREIQVALWKSELSASLIYSSDRDLDVVPEGADKGSAVTFLAGHWRLSKDRVVVSGDSGNDLAMFQQDFRGVVVANAHQDLKDLAGPTVFVSRFSYADGVLDGLRQWLSNDLEA